MTPLIVPVFVPHAGCPRQCSFCNQRRIAGVQDAPDAQAVERIVVLARKSLGERMQSAELAFFGGSFTAIDAHYRAELLAAARPHIGGNGFAGIRISTRPDCVGGEILDELTACGVRTIELGVQSMRDSVLEANRRGHTADDAVRAARRIRGRGFSLGLQMMTGLYKDNDAGALETAEKLIALRPDFVRVYPTVVLEGTELAELWRGGGYQPQTLDEAIALGARLLRLFAEYEIPVIRFGLHDEAGLADAALAGPHHPALRELCENRIMLDRALQALSGRRIPKGAVTLRVHPRWISRMAGQRRENLRTLARMGYSARVRGGAEIAPMCVEPVVESKG